LELSDSVYDRRRRVQRDPLALGTIKDPETLGVAAN
jgi:hypothetical protein